MLDIEWKAANQTQILKAIEDLKRLVNERNLSLNEAKKLLFAPVNQVDSSSENWQALKDSYLASKSDRRSTTLKDINTRLNNLLVTLEKTPKPRTGRDALIGSGLRLEENINARDLKEVSNCLKALGFEKDDTQTRVNATKKYLYH